MGSQHCGRALIAAGMLVVASGAHAKDERRELGPHVHGLGALAIAVEGNEVRMELVAPGIDIVGFEHEADTARQKKAVEAALADLKEPLKLFVLPPDAGCEVTAAKVELFGEDHDHHDAAPGTDTSAEAEEDEDGHAEFRASYALACEDASQIRLIHFPYFDRFRDAERLGVTIIDADGEARAEVSRMAPTLEN